MYIEIAQLVVSIINAVQARQNGANQRDSLGHYLQVLHSQLSAIVKNGDAILTILEMQCNGETIDLDDLCRALAKQQLCFGRVNHTLQSNALPQVLTKYATNLETLWVLVSEKEGRLGLLRRCVEPRIARRRLVHPKNLISYVGKIDFPSIDSVATTRVELDRIRGSLEQLRLLACEPYDLDEMR